MRQQLSAYAAPHAVWVDIETANFPKPDTAESDYRTVKIGNPEYFAIRD